jgi:hypothetical protein
MSTYAFSGALDAQGRLWFIAGYDGRMLLWVFSEE